MTGGRANPGPIAKARREDRRFPAQPQESLSRITNDELHWGSRLDPCLEAGSWGLLVKPSRSCSRRCEGPEPAAVPSRQSPVTSHMLPCEETVASGPSEKGIVGARAERRLADRPRHSLYH